MGLKTGRKTIEVRPHVAKMTILKSFLTIRSDLANFDHLLFSLGLFCTYFLTAIKLFISFFVKLRANQSQQISLKSDDVDSEEQTLCIQSQV